MAVNMFLKFEGPDVKGESEVKGHEKEIDVHAWKWKMTQSGDMHRAAGGGAGKVDIQDIQIIKDVDAASPVLMAYCCSGQHYDKATLMVYKAGGKQPVEYLKLVMEKVIISSVSQGGDIEKDIVPEELWLNFSKYKITYTPQKATGEAGAPIDQTWDIAKNVAG
ncbi:MAG TPA: type VI secretion system tube protein Hcp [Syntrophobacteraceae bacterium]|nr:type VI secretion system tube protein Hcp [Syntrophobacteraceae bacterium]